MRGRCAPRRGSNLPHLRFSRDKRGYENTFVVHSARRRGKGRSRILYWFRTPPGVRVGRAALDEDAIRLIEEHNPDIDFNWTQILRSQDVTPAESATMPSERRAQLPAGRARREDRFEKPRGPRAPDEAAKPEVLPVELPPAAEEQSEAAESLVEFTAGLDEADATFVDGTPVYAGGDDLEEAQRPIPAAQARLGAEGLIRLRARYAELIARISDRVSDSLRQEELKTQAERLNPDNWVTEQEVREGLEQYESTFEALRAVVGRRRKKRRRRPGPGEAANGPGGSGGEGSDVAQGEPNNDNPER
jgi:hypothetical protein